MIPTGNESIPQIFVDQSMIFSNKINASKVLSSFFLIMIIAVVCVIITEQPQNASALTSPTGLVVPLYSYPGTTWDELIKEKNAHPSIPIIAIINPDNGPGVSDPNYATGVQKLQAARITVLGYVYTQKIDTTTITNYINDYKKWYNVNGIFFDQMSNIPGDETFYKHLSDYAKSIGLSYTVGNPGIDTLPTYIGTVDNLVIYDNPGLLSISSLGGWHTNFTKNNFSIVSYGINDINQTYVTNAAKYVQYMYITNSTLPNPFSTLPRYLDNLLGVLESVNKQNDKVLPVSITVKSYSIKGLPIDGLWTAIESDKNSSAGFTPFSFTAFSGNRYAITVSNFQNYAFDHWNDGTINNTKIVTPTQNIALTAYYRTGQNHVGFSHIHFARGMYNVLVTGQYTNGDTPYLAMFPRLDLYDQSGHLVSTGRSTVWNIGAYDSKPFQVTVKAKDFKSYAITVDNAIPKNPSTPNRTSSIMPKNQMSPSITQIIKPDQVSSCKCATPRLDRIKDTGSIAVNLYVGEDRSYYSSISLKIYQDSNQTVYRNIESISGNPFNITYLPLDHRYKIEVYANGMRSDTEYVDLKQTQEKLSFNLPLPGGLRPNIFYNDGYTPISNATVNVKSQDNKTWATDSTDVNGNTLRFWLEPTSMKDNYFIVEVKIGQHLSHSYSPVFLRAGTLQDIKIVTPWPAKIDSLLTVKVYDENSNLSSPIKHNFVVDLFDNNGNKIAQSKVNSRGEANFSNLIIGDYVIRAIDTTDNMKWGESKITIDGTKTNFAIFKN